MSGRCPDPYCAGYMPAPCLCLLSNVFGPDQPQTPHQAMSHLWQIAQWCRFPSGPRKTQIHPHLFRRPICRSPHHRSKYRCRGQICGGNPQSADHHLIPPSNSSSPSPVQITLSSLPPDRALSPRCEMSVSVPAPPFSVSFPHASDRWSCPSPPNT